MAGVLLRTQQTLRTSAMSGFVSHRGHTIYADGLTAAPLVLDLGANHGLFADEMARIYGASCVLVEANPALADLLARTHPRVLSCAVAATHGRVAFNIARNDEGSSLLTLPSTSTLNCVLAETVDVEAHTLAELVADVGAPDILKIDIEGAEIDVLLATPADVLRGIGQLTVEFHSDPVFGFGRRDDVERVLRHLSALNFLAIDFSYPSRMDVLFVNRRKHRVSRFQKFVVESRHGFGEAKQLARKRIQRLTTSR